ncbi:MAG TPA: hypothetical protein VF406_09245 [Thermodesulfobacteriota bacterium]
MFAAAQILFENSGGARCLEWLLAELPRRISRPVSRTEWRGFTTVVPQIRVETRPVALTIQFDDDAAYVPAEIEETAAAVRGRIDSQALAALQRCRARLDIMSATPVEPVVTQDTISVVAETDLDPASPEVAAVLEALADITQGFVLDCVNGRLRPPASRTWVPLEPA